MTSTHLCWGGQRILVLIWNFLQVYIHNSVVCLPLCMSYDISNRFSMSMLKLFLPEEMTLPALSVSSS